MCIKFQLYSFHSSWEICNVFFVVFFFPLQVNCKTYQGMKLQDLWFLGLILVFTIPQPTSTCVPSFNSVTLTVVEKSVMKIYLMRTDGMPGGRKEERREGRNKWMTEGQGKSSIVPPFCLETHSKEMRRKKNKESVVLLACDTPTWLMSLPNIIKLSQTVCELLPVQDFGFRVDNYLTKKVWFVSLARDMPTSLSTGSSKLRSKFQELRQ